MKTVKFRKNIAKNLGLFVIFGLLIALAFSPVQKTLTSSFAALNSSWSPKIDPQSFKAQGIVVSPTEGAVKNTQTNTTLNFSKNQLILKINDETSLQTILNTYGFKLIDDGKIPAAPNGVVKETRKVADFPYYVVEITDENNQNLQNCLKNKNVNGLVFDSKESATTFALSKNLSAPGLESVYLNQTLDLSSQRIDIVPRYPEAPVIPVNDFDPNLEEEIINDFYTDYSTPYYNTNEWQNALNDWANGLISDTDLQNIEAFLHDFWNRFINWADNANKDLQNLVRDFNGEVNDFVRESEYRFNDFLNERTWEDEINDFLKDLNSAVQPDPVIVPAPNPIIGLPSLPAETGPVNDFLQENNAVNDFVKPTEAVNDFVQNVDVKNETQKYGDVNFEEKYVLKDAKTINEAVNITDLKNNKTSVAVIDYGFDLRNYDLTGENLINKEYKNNQLVPVGYDFGCKNYLQKGSVTKDATHGTEIAATILGAAGNNYGVAGITQNAQLIALRAGAACESSDLHIWNVIKSIKTANAWGADVINMSFGFNSDESNSVKLLQEVVNEAKNNGVVLVAAGGNYGKLDGKDENGLMYPANIEGVIAVGGLKDENTKADWSNYGKYIQVWADGTIPVTHSEEKSKCYGEKYGCSQFNVSNDQGTSFSAAIVSGVIATLKQVDPKIDATKTVSVLMNSGKVVEGETGKVVDLKAAVTELLKQNGAVNNVNAINVNQKQEDYNFSLFEF